MRLIFLSLLAFILAFSISSKAGTSNNPPEPFIGQLVSVDLRYGKPYNENWALIEETSSSFDEDIIIVSNACGYAKAGFHNINLKRDEENLFVVGQVIGEWCKSSFSALSPHRDYLIIPIKKNMNRSWQEGSYESDVLEVYDEEQGYFTDIWDVRFMLEYKSNKKVDWKALDKKFMELSLPLFTEDLIAPIELRQLEVDEEVVLDGLEAEIYSIQDRKLFLKKALRVDKLYKK